MLTDKTMHYKRAPLSRVDATSETWQRTKVCYVARNIRSDWGEIAVAALFTHSPCDEAYEVESWMDRQSGKAPTQGSRSFESMIEARNLGTLGFGLLIGNDCPCAHCCFPSLPH